MRFLILLLTFAISLSAGELTIIATSDIQSNLVSFKAKEGRYGGLARIATLKKEFEKKGTHVLLLSTVDDLFGPFYSIFHGKPEFVTMSRAGYDVVCPGNHEFDYGIQIFKDAVTHAEFDIVCSNISFQDTLLKRKILPWTIKEVGGAKIGFFGLMTPELFRVSNPGKGVSLDQDVVEVAQKTVKKLKSQGCQLIVALTHIGFDLDREIAEKVEGIDIIVGGHDHDVIFKKVRNTYILHAGSRGKYAGVFTFDYNNGIKNPAWQLIVVDTTIKPDPVVQDYVLKVWKNYESELKREIGYTSVPLDARKSTVRKRESNLGDMIADSWLGWFKTADVALVTGGSIRGDKIYPAGPVTYKTINSILPFRNEIMEVTLTGRELKQVLEISASALRVAGDGVSDTCRASSGGFLQVAGLRVTIDTTRSAFSAIYDGRKVKKILNPGSRVVRVLLKRGSRWERLDPNGEYRVLINRWMAGGGDGYFVFLDKKCKNTTVITTDVLINYVKTHRNLQPVTDGRIKIIP